MSNRTRPVNRVTSTPPRNPALSYAQNAVAAGTPPPPVPAQLESLDSRVKDLCDAVDSIERVIDAVCTPQPPSPSAGTTSDKEMAGASPVAERIRALGDQVQHATGRLRFLTARVEL